MIKLFVSLGMLMIGGVSLSACSKSSDRDAPQAVDFSSDASRPEDRFGKSFSDKFHADPNSEPANVNDNDLPPVSETTEPIPVG